jgi:hypothetical protein
MLMQTGDPQSSPSSNQEIKPVSNWHDALRRNLAGLEAVEMGLIWLLAGLIWAALTLLGQVPAAWIWILLSLPALYLCWGSYWLYIFVSRKWGSDAEFALWLGIAAVTLSISFWVWMVLDGVRWLITRRFYQGEIPLEYACSHKSKLYRRAWDYAHLHHQTAPTRAEFYEWSRRNLLCPTCGRPLPFDHAPANPRQARYGGWTCANCGSEIDWRGRMISG